MQPENQHQSATEIGNTPVQPNLAQQDIASTLQPGEQQAQAQAQATSVSQPVSNVDQLQVNPSTYQPSAMNGAPIAVAPQNKKFIWLKVVVVIVILLIIGAVVLSVTQNKKATDTQDSARINFAAQSDINFLQQPLENFYATNNYYPSDISQSTFNTLGVQVSGSTLTPPAGTKYVYTPTPAGCTTAAKNCTTYTLSIVNDSTGSTIATAKSTAGQQ